MIAPPPPVALEVAALATRTAIVLHHESVHAAASDAIARKERGDIPLSIRVCGRTVWELEPAPHGFDLSTAVLRRMAEGDAR